jgi:hypothetical protein
MRDRVVAVLVIALVAASAGAGYYVGFQRAQAPDDVQVSGSVSLFSNNRCCIAPTYVRFFYVGCQPELYASCVPTYNSTLSQIDGLGYAYSVTVPNGHQYTINTGVRFSNDTEITCTASFIPIYSYSQTLGYNITSSCP